MTSAISFPERLREARAVFFHALKKSTGMLTLYAVLQLLLLPVVVTVALQNVVSDYNAGFAAPSSGSLAERLARTYSALLQGLLPGVAVPMALLFALVLCVRLFGYLQNRRSVDLYHALPVGRVPMLLGRWCAGLAALLIPQAVGFGVLALVACAFGIPASGSGSLSAGTGLLWLLLVTAAAFTFSVFMEVCSGSTMDAVLSVLGVNAGYPALLLCALYLAQRVLPGLGDDILNPTVLTLFAPFAAAFLPFFSGLGLTIGAGFTAWWLCFTAALLAAACRLYRRRGSEAAEDHFAFPIPKGVIRFLLTGAAGLGLGLILKREGSLTGFLVGVLIGSLAAHVVVEAVYSRGFRGMKKSLPWYGVFLVSFAVFYGVLATGCFGYDTRVPEASEVESVAVQPSGSRNSLSIYADSSSRQTIAAIRPALSEPESVRAAVETQRSIIEFYRSEGRFYLPRTLGGSPVRFDYKLKNGKHLKRTYQYYTQDQTKNDAYQQTAERLAELPEFIQSSDPVFYLEPEDLKNIEIYFPDANKDSGSKVVVLDSSAGSQLFAALRQDLLDRKVNDFDRGGERIALSLIVVFKDGITPQSDALKKALGGYRGTIWMQNGNYTFFDENSATYQLIRKMGWYE